MKTLRALFIALTFALTGAVHAASLYNGVCYANDSDAVDAYYSSARPEYFMSGSQDYMRNTVSTGGVWKTYFYYYSGGNWVLSVSSTLPSPTFPTCDPTLSDFDPTTAAELWGFFFTSVLTLWFTAKGVGAVITTVKQS